MDDTNEKCFQIENIINLSFASDTTQEITLKSRGKSAHNSNFSELFNNSFPCQCYIFKCCYIFCQLFVERYNIFAFPYVFIKCDTIYTSFILKLKSTNSFLVYCSCISLLKNRNKITFIRDVNQYFQNGESALFTNENYYTHENY